VNFGLGGFNQTLNLALPSGATHEIFREMLRLMIEKATGEAIEPHIVARNFSRISEILGEERLSTLISLLDKANFEDEFSNEEWSKIQPDFFRRLRDKKSTKFGLVADAIQHGLNELTRELWLEALKDEKSELGLLFNMIEWKEVKLLTTAYYDALLDHSKLIIGGGQAPKKFVGRWSELPGALIESHRSNFCRTVADELLNNAPEASVVAVLLDLMGPDLLKDAELARFGENRVIRTLLHPLLASADAGSLACVENHCTRLRSKGQREQGFDGQFRRQ
jgi:hypothetical protein